NTVGPDRPTFAKRVEEHESARNEKPRKVHVRRDVEEQEHRRHHDEAHEAPPKRDDAILERPVVPPLVANSHTDDALMIWMQLDRAAGGGKRSFGDCESLLRAVPLLYFTPAQAWRRLRKRGRRRRGVERRIEWTRWRGNGSGVAPPGRVLRCIECVAELGG